MPVSNVSAVTMPDGEIYGYICGKGCLWRYHANGAGTGIRTQLKTSAATPNESRPIQVLLNRNEGFNQTRHVFYRQPKTDNIWYGQDAYSDGGSAVLSVRQLHTAAGNVIHLTRTFGAVALADGVILIGIAPNTKADIRIISIPWKALDSSTWMQGVTAATKTLPLSKNSGPGSLDEDGCEVSCEAIVHPGYDTPYAVISAKRKDGKTWRLGCWTAPVTEGLQLGKLAEHPQRWTGDSIKFSKVQVLRDNSAVLYYLDGKTKAHWFTNTALGLIGFDNPEAPSSPTNWTTGSAQNPLSIIDKMSKGPTKKVNYGGNAFHVVSVEGKASSKPGKLNPDLTDVTVPIRAGLLYYNGDQKLGELYGSGVWLNLTRTARPQVPGRQILVGIIEGAPPIPNENLNMSDHYDPLRYFNGPGYAQAVFAGSESEEDGMEVDWTAGTVVKSKVEAKTGVEIPLIAKAKAFFEVEVSLKAAVTNTYTDLETKQSVSTIYAGAEIEGDGTDKPYSVQPSGVLVFQNADWTAYEYSYRQPNGMVSPGSVSAYQIKPTNVAVTAVPYLMNPDHGPHPGKLGTYRISEDETKALERRSIIDLGNGTGYLTGAWGYDTKTVATFGMTDTTKRTTGFSLNLEALVTVGMEGKLLGFEGKAGIGLGVKFDLACTWSSTSKKGIDVGGEVWLRGNSQAPDAYTSYTWRTYLLEQSKQWTTDLLAGLCTDIFPTNAYEREQQQRLVEMIDPSSKPWKLCYSLGESFFNQPLPALETLLPAQWGTRLAAAGVETTYTLAKIVERASGADDDSPPELGAAQLDLVDELRAHPEQLNLLREVVAQSALAP